MSATFGFVQFEFTHEIGPVAGRYIIEPRDEQPQGEADPDDSYAPVPMGDELFGRRRGVATADVLVISVRGGEPVGGRRLLARRPQRAEGEDPPAPTPVCVATLIRATEPFDSKASAETWLTACLEDPASRERVLAQGLRQLNLAVRAFRVSSGDPYMVEFTGEDPRALRVGYGGAEEVAEGRWDRAFVVPAGERERESRADRLRPAEVAASILAGKVPLLEGEELLLIAHRELQQDRPRGAALSARAAMQLLRSDAGPRTGDMTTPADQLAEVDKALEPFVAVALKERPSEEQQMALWDVLRDAVQILDDWRGDVLLDAR